MPGSACANVEPEASVVRLGELECAPDVVRNDANLLPRGHESGTQLLGGVEHGVDDSVVTDVRPRVIHVEDCDVDAVGGRRGNGAVDANVFEEIVQVVAFGHSST